MNAAAANTGVQVIAPINICDMDNALNALCVAVQVARNKIFDANCRASGVCHSESFVYVPSLYSSAYQEFVRDTVETFYLNEKVDACPLANDTSNAVRTRNGLTVKDCASTQLQIVYDILRNLRDVIDHIMHISYLYFMVQINLLRFIFTGATGPKPEATTDNPDQEDDHAWGQVIRYWELLMNEAEKLWNALGDLVYDFIMDSGFGKVLQDFIDWVCSAIQWVIDEMWIVVFSDDMLEPMGDWMVEGFLGNRTPEGSGLPDTRFSSTGMWY